MAVQPTTALTRRRLLLGAGALAVLGSVGALAPATSGGPRLDRTFVSAAVRRPVGWSVGWPEGTGPGDPLPLLLVLHGLHDSHREVLGSHDLGTVATDVARGGVPPFAVVGVDGGRDWWHRRASGVDPQAMILDELLPRLARLGLRTDRLALGGWSMGGYGALLLAERLGPDRVAAVVADSAAVWERPTDARQGAFDSAADFAAHDVLGAAGRLAAVPVRLTCGTADPLLACTERLVAALPRAEHRVGPGRHDTAFWRGVAPAQLAFAGEHLAR